VKFNIIKKTNILFFNNYNKNGRRTYAARTIR
jgi:hypothetical protein